MASFQAKIGCKRLRKRENKNYPSVPFLAEAWKKIAKKFKKLKNTNVASLSAKIGLKRLGKRENKNYNSVSFLSDA